MKIFIISVISAILLFNTGFAFGGGGKGNFSLGLNCGGFFPTVNDDNYPYSINNNLIVGMSLDLRFNRRRLLNLSYDRIRNSFFFNGKKKGAIYSHPLILSFRQNLYSWGPFIPYIKGGGGYVFNTVDISIPNTSVKMEDDSASQVSVGIDIYLTEKTIFNTDIGYINYNQKLKIKNNVFEENQNFDMSGIRTTFGFKIVF